MSNPSRIALVTGASKGVGRGIAYGMADAGWDVIVNYFSDQAGAEETVAGVIAKGRQAWAVMGDVSNRESVIAMFEYVDANIGSIGALVNNSGRQTWAPLLELTLEDWNKTINTNLTGSFLCTQQAAMRMKDNGGGSIINIGSGANRTPFPNLVDYCASKGGLDQLTRVSAVELGKYGIRVNCVAPGAIEIERTKLEDPTYGATWAAVTPIGRVGQVEDVAAAVVYLTSIGGEFITGQTLWVDGGLWTQGVWPYERK